MNNTVALAIGFSTSAFGIGVLLYTKYKKSILRRRILRE